MQHLTHGRTHYAHRRAGNRELPRATLDLQMPPPPLPPAVIDTLVSTPSALLDRWVSHPGYGVEPQQVISIYRQAEQGWPQRQVDLFADITESDGHLTSSLQKRILGVAGKTYQIMAGGNTRQDVVAAELLSAVLSESNLEDLIIHQLSMRGVGWAGSEIRWEQVDGDIVPTWFVNVPHRRFRFDEHGRPRFMTRLEDYEGSELRPGCWVFSRNAVAGNVARSGLMRTATWYSLFKRWSWRDWVIYVEKYGIPIVLGRHERDATEEDVETLKRAVEDIGEANQATMSKDTDIEVKDTNAQSGGGSATLHAGVVSEANLEISKLVNGSTLTMAPGATGASYALGKVHQSGSFELVLADARMVARLFREYVATPFLTYNGFRQAAPPRLVIHVQQESDPLQRASVAAKLQGMGLAIDSEQMREEFQLRPPPDAKRTLVAVAPAGGAACDGTPDAGDEE